MDHETHIHVYNFMTRELEYELDMKVNLSSIAISQNSHSLLINKIDGEARMLDLDTRETIRSFKSGVKGEKNFVIRATYGGANESFVIIGSEGESNALLEATLNANHMSRGLCLHLAQRDRATD